MLKTIARFFRREPAPAACAEAAAAAEGPHDLDSLFAQPLAAVHAGHTHEAILQLEALVETHPEIAEAHVLLGDLLLREKRFEEAQDSYLIAFGLKPDWPTPHHKLGVIALEQGNWDDAARSLRRALDLGAREGGVHNALGTAHLHMGNVSAAVEQFRQALAVEPELAQAHSNLGYVLFHELEQYEEGARHIERALALAPADPAALCNRLMMLDHFGGAREALELADELLDRDPAHAEARFNRALILLKSGDFGAGWPEYEARKRIVLNRFGNDLPWPEWDGSDLANRAIYVYSEQGLGDQIMLASCVPELLARAQRCTVECDPRLAAIFRRSFPGAEILTKDAWRSSRALALRPPDFKVAIGSLPGFFRTDRSAFPAHDGYLRADPAKVAQWKARLAHLPGRKAVGISWRGGVASTRRGLRSIALDRWVPLLTLPEVSFISLQYSNAESEIAALHNDKGIMVQHWAEAIDDYDETAALVTALDLVVSVQTAVVHLAGALGKTTWALISALPEWRYGAEGRSMPWYPAVELLRQREAGDWDGVMDTAREKLRAWSTPLP